MDGPSSIRKVLYPGRHDRLTLQALTGAIHPEIFGVLESVGSLLPDRLAGATSKII
jgi:hypothetical protein